MQITQLNHVALHCADLAASLRFYRDVLGLPEMPRPAFSFPGAWLRIGSGRNDDQELHLIQRDPKEGEYTIPRERHFALSVVSIGQAEQTLQQHGVTYQPPKPRPDGVLQIFLRDPDSHVVELCGPI